MVEDILMTLKDKNGLAQVTSCIELITLEQPNELSNNQGSTDVREDKGPVRGI